MIVLGIDTAGPVCSLALTGLGGGTEATPTRIRRVAAIRHGQGEALIDLLDSALAEAGWRVADIELIGVTTGPGGFTGLRLGLAAAAGLALSCGAGIVGVPSFDALSAGLGPAPADTVQLLAIDSRRAEPFVRLPGEAGSGDAGPRERYAALGDLPGLMRNAMSGRHVAVAGDAAGMAVKALTDAGVKAIEANPAPFDPAVPPGTIDPAVVADMAHRRRAQAAAYPPPPLYLRPPDATPTPGAPR